MAEEAKVVLSKKDRFKAFLRLTLILGSFNYERMQNGGVCYSMIPAIKKLYKSESDRAEALKRHLEFFNTTPELFSPILGVVLSLEQDKANGADVDDSAISGVKVGMMGPLAGIGDPIFLFTLRPILGSLCGAMAISGNVLGPILFFILWNLIRGIFMWNLQEFGYKAGSRITEDVSGSLLHDVTRGASMMGMFVLGGLIDRWVKVDFKPIVSTAKMQKGTYIDWSSLPSGHAGIQKALELYNNGQGLALSSTKVTTMQNIFDQLIPGLAGLLITFLCMWLLKKNVSPIWIIIGLFAVGIIGHLIGLL